MVKTLGELVPLLCLLGDNPNEPYIYIYVYHKPLSLELETVVMWWSVKNLDMEDERNVWGFNSPVGQAAS